jgi:nitroimidazol reductase NimA-like FMN-containing flavoprotein (pyridoxamine 5'-phosphate oxidase superfamily)
VTAQGIVFLDRPECLRLLQFKAFLGRVGFLDGGRMQITPVNYLADEKGLVFCSGPGAKLSALRHGAPVVFEVDEGIPFEHSGWSVVVHGTAQEITDPTELEYLRRGQLKSWAMPPTEHWIRIDIQEISGVRIAAH